MYNITAVLCALIRFFVLPNSLQMAIDFPEHSFLVFVLAEPILYFVTYFVVGIYYQKGYDNPIKGSILYLIFYFIHMGLFYLMGLFGFNTVAIVVIVVLYIAAHIGFAELKDFLFGGV